MGRTVVRAFAVYADVQRHITTGDIVSVKDESITEPANRLAVCRTARHGGLALLLGADVAVASTKARGLGW